MRKVVALLPVEDFWRPMLATLFCLALLATLLTFRLGTLTPGFAEAEYQQRSTATTTKDIISNPLHLHQKVGQLALQKLGHKGPAAMRASSVLLGIAAAISMYVILKNWYTPRVAILGTLLFATSSWTLHVARLATPDINFALPLLLLLGGVWLHQNKFTLVATALTLIAGILMFYVPGMIWFILFIVIWRWRIIGRMIGRLNSSQQISAVLLVLLGLGPLVWALSLDPALALTWFGFPANWPSFTTYLSNLAAVPIEIFLRGAGDPTYGIGRLPLLDAFTGSMVVLGGFTLLFRLGLDRTILLIGTAVMGVLLIALDGPVTITFLLPVVYLLATAGIALLLQQWFTVFPRNPVARALGVFIVSTTVLLACGYHLSHYFIAWPNVPATKATFSRQP